MAIELCPHCREFTEQSFITDFKEKRTSPYLVISNTRLSFCWECEQTVEHEEIEVQEEFPIEEAMC